MSPVVIAIAITATTIAMLLPLGPYVVVFGSQVPMAVVLFASEAVIFILGYRVGFRRGQKGSRLRI
jgi:hypothetical protein